MSLYSPFPRTLSAFFLYLLYLIILFLPLNLWAQNTKSANDIEVFVEDMRGKGYEIALQAALLASKRDYVVALVCDAPPDAIDATEAEIKNLIREGYPRVIMILSDAVPEGSSIVVVVAGFESSDYMTEVSDHSQYRYDLRQSIRSAYEKHIPNTKSD